MSNADLLRSNNNANMIVQQQQTVHPTRAYSKSPEKRESRLTSIIDQLLISKRSFGAGGGGGGGVDSAAADPENEESHKSKSSGGATKKQKKSSSHNHQLQLQEKRGDEPKEVKNERLSPEERSASTSPPLKQMEHMMTRNYSDLMRNLAAKYNHSNPNERFTRPLLDFDTRFLKPGAAAAAASLLISFEKNMEKDANNVQFPVIDMSSTNALLSMVRSATAQQTNQQNNIDNYVKASLKRANSPLDLSGGGGGGVISTSGGGGGGGKLSPPPPKKKKIPCVSACMSGCTSEGQTMLSWNVEEVCHFVQTIDLCREYVQAFHDQSIDGSSLPLLTEDHLMTTMNMKLGPALKFKSVVAKKLGNCSICSHCVHCHENNNNANNNEK